MTNYVNDSKGMSKDQAEKVADDLRAILSADFWDVKVVGALGSPSAPTAYKTVAQSKQGGLSVVCSALTGRFFVWGLVGKVKVEKTENFKIVGFETAEGAVQALTKKLTALHNQATKQFACVRGL